MLPLLAVGAIIGFLSAVALKYGWHVVSEHVWDGLVDSLNPFHDDDDENGGWMEPIKTALGIGTLVIVGVVLLAARGRK